MITPYLRDMIDDHKATKTQSGEWKIQLSMRVNFISSKDNGETRTIYVWSDNAKIMVGIETDDIIKELFESSLDNYQQEEQVMRGESDFIFESVELIDYHPHKISLKRGKSYIESSEWLINKGATINQKKKKKKKIIMFSVCINFSIKL